MKITKIMAMVWKIVKQGNPNLVNVNTQANVLICCFVFFVFF